MTFANGKSSLQARMEPPPILFMLKDDKIAERNALILIEEGQWYKLDNGGRPGRTALTSTA